MTFEIYKLEWILSRHTFGNTTTFTISIVIYCDITIFYKSAKLIKII